MLLGIDTKGLKCDAEGCGYKDMSIEARDYEKYLNAPCPNCGAPLLTEADLKTCRAMEAAVAALNNLADAAGIRTIRDPAKPKLRVPIEMRGDGSLTLGKPRID